MDRQEVVLLSALAEELKVDKSNLRRKVLGYGISMFKVRTKESRGQETLALTPEDAETVREQLGREYVTSSGTVAAPESEVGYFYVIQPVPELDENRVKLGYSSDVEARLRSYQVIVPTAKVLFAIPCKRQWERAIIDSVTRVDCQPLSAEVFQCGDAKALLERVQGFLDLLPSA